MMICNQLIEILGKGEVLSFLYCDIANWGVIYLVIGDSPSIMDYYPIWEGPSLF